MEEWVVKMMEIAGMAKQTTLIRDRTLSKFKGDQKPLNDFLQETIKCHVVLMIQRKIIGFRENAKNAVAILYLYLQQL